jgi:hypothetical protein
MESRFTPIQRSKIYINVLSTFLSKGLAQEKYPEDEREYPFGLCWYIAFEAQNIDPTYIAYHFTNPKANFPELWKQKPFFKSSSGSRYWWNRRGRKGYEKRVAAMQKALILVNKKIKNDRKTKSTMVLGNTSQSDKG